MQMNNLLFKDTISPIQSTYGNIRRDDLLKRKALNIMELYDINSNRFKGKTEEFKSLFISCIEDNLWEMCYFLIEKTGYRIPKSLFHSSLELAAKRGNTTFMYAVMELGDYSSIRIFKDIDENSHRQREHLNQLTESIYGAPLSQFRIEERQKIFKDF